MVPSRHYSYLGIQSFNISYIFRIESTLLKNILPCAVLINSKNYIIVYLCDYDRIFVPYNERHAV